MLLTGVTIDAIWLGVGFIIMGGRIYLAANGRLNHLKSGRRGGSGSAKSNRGFMEGLESRWDDADASSKVYRPWHSPF